MMSFSDIDFAARYRDHVRRTGRRERTPEYWNDRAAALSQRVFDAPYVRQFVARMDLRDCTTLLDVGCGPGTIGLSVPSQLDHVYGLDYSPGMLTMFAENARQRGLTRVTPMLRAWEADWADVPVCDIVVASRSTAVPDLEATLVKLDSKARRPYTVLIFVAAGIVAIATHPQWTLVVIAYSYLASAFIGMAITRFKHRGGVPVADAEKPDADRRDSAAR